MDQPEFLPGVPDNFQRLWTPHRLVYIKNGQQPPADECPFCLMPEGSDEDGLIVFRGNTCFVLLNLYPYNSGHLLICTYRHVADYDQTTPEEAAEMAELSKTSMVVLREVANAQGFNLGMNQGELAGAGIAGHLHQHVVPRWSNDSNFFPIIAKTKAMPRLLGEIRSEIQKAWPKQI
jgi:ATP adenylyltransferase